MSEKVTGKRADISREASGQISAPSYEPLLRKYPYKEIVPEILAGTPKNARKIRKIAQSLPFMESNMSIKFRNKITSGSHGKKKILNIDPN
jgi:hypothetical protein